MLTSSSINYILNLGTDESAVSIVMVADFIMQCIEGTWLIGIGENTRYVFGANSYLDLVILISVRLNGNDP